MKKFTQITDSKIAQKSNNDEINEVINIKYTIYKLIEEFLKTTIYGPIDPILQGTIKIEGKEEFTEALIELMKQDVIKEQIKLLESAKYVGIDNTLNSLYNINESITPSEKSKHTKRVKDLIKRANGDINKLITDCERQANSIKNGEKAFYRAIAAENLIDSKRMDKKELKEISKIFLFRSQQLGYRK